MNCKFHPDNEVSHSCLKCGVLICEQCRNENEGKSICQNCKEIKDKREDIKEIERGKIERKEIERTINIYPSNNSIMSMIFGIASILCCCVPGVFSIPAVILAIIDLKNIANNKSSEKSRTYSIIGLICGTIGILLSLIMIIAIITSGITNPDFWNFWEEIGKLFNSKINTT